MLLHNKMIVRVPKSFRLISCSKNNLLLLTHEDNYLLIKVLILIGWRIFGALGILILLVHYINWIIIIKQLNKHVFYMQEETVFSL